jgi:hypothetical protein
LKRVCALVLAHVPHSDDMSDDPLKYIAAQIQEGKKVAQERAKERKPTKITNVEAPTGVTHQFLDIQDDSATPSETSHRDTINATDYCTPLTSAGITPGETARRFSDAARKSLTGTKKPGSNLRNETSSLNKSRTASTGVRSLDASKPNPEVEAIKTTLRIVTDGSSRRAEGGSKSMDVPRPVRFSALDLNKSLPPPPSDEILFEEKQPHISRLMKTIRKKKSHSDVGRSMSSDSSPSLPSAEAVRTPYPHASLPPRLPEQKPPKKKFRIPLFSRRQRPADVLVT